MSRTHSIELQDWSDGGASVHAVVDFIDRGENRGQWRMRCNDCDHRYYSETPGDAVNEAFVHGLNHYWSEDH